MLVEFVAMLPILALAVLVCVQGLIVASGAVLLQVAAERSAQGAPAEEAASALPAAWRDGLELTRDGDTVRAELSLPMVLPGPAPVLSAEVEPA